MTTLIDKKLVLFGGKGGVGKTSCAAAAGLYAAGKGRKTLVLSTDPAHSLSDSFEKHIGGRVTKLREDLFALELDAGELLVDFRKKYLGFIKQIADEGTFFSREDIQEFFDLSLPGLDELMALFKIIDLLEEDEYDLLIVDTAPTGHTIRLLELPDLMTSYVRVLAEMRQKHHVVVSMMVGKYVRDEADEFIEKLHADIMGVKAVLSDAGKTTFVPVTIPEALSVSETRRLVDALKQHDIPVEEIIVNNVFPSDCGFCKARRSEQEKYIRELKKQFPDYKLKEVPLFPTEIRGESLKVLSRILFGGRYSLPQPTAVLPAFEPEHVPFKIEEGVRLLLFGGKGGVGKTSCAAATALHMSEKKKVLVFSIDPAHSLSDSFGVPIGDKVSAINKNLDALEVDAQKMLLHLKEKYRREVHEFFGSVFRPTTKALIDAPYDRRVIEDLFDLCPPGLDEIMALKTLVDYLRGGDYDLFILDTAPTGHAIRLLEMPELAEGWVRALIDIQEKYPIPSDVGETLVEMLESIRQVRAVITDPDKTQFVVVSIPEALAVLETRDLVGSLKKLSVPADYLIVNKIMPDSKCGFCRSKRGQQMGYVKELSGIGLKTVSIELFNGEIKGDNLIKLGESLFG